MVRYFYSIVAILVLATVQATQAGPLSVPLSTTSAISQPSDQHLESDNRIQSLYMLCAFYPQPDTCDSVYQRAMKDDDVSALAVKAEFKGYARYLRGIAPLTDADRKYLKENNIFVPNDFGTSNLTGLHNVINDPTLSASDRKRAVNNFLSRAVEAELYCAFNPCKGAQKEGES